MRDTKWLANVLVSAALTAIGAAPLHAEDCGNRPARWFQFRHRPAPPSPDCAVPVPAGMSTPAAVPASVPKAEPADVPANSPTQQFAAAAAGPAMFTAPPPSGEITGASQRWGVQLPSMTLPELRLAAPTFHMPSIVRSSRDAEMYVDGGRAPRVAGMPAAYGQLVNAAPASMPQPTAAAPASVNQPQRNVTPAAAPAAVPAGAPAAAPAGVDSCVNYYPSHAMMDAPVNSTEAELVETRKAVIILSERLQRLQREVEVKTRTNGAVQEAELPPLPTSSDRRSSYSNSVASAAMHKRNASPKIVRAGYSDSEFEENEEPVSRTETRLRRDTRGASNAEPGEWAAAPTKKAVTSRQPLGNLRTRSSDGVDANADSYEDVMVDSVNARNVVPTRKNR